VARSLWSVESEIMQVSVGTDFESVAKLWLGEKKYEVVNTCTSAVIWTLWKFLNELYFQGSNWLRMKPLMRRCAGMLRAWRILHKDEGVAKLEGWAKALEKRSQEPPRIA
jgi:hypothetical protein